MKTVMMMAMSLTVLASSNAFGVAKVDGLDPNLTPGKAAQVAGVKPCPYGTDVARGKNTNVNEQHAAATNNSKAVSR